jgi:SAM-dependent methyltransferase
MTDAAQRGQVAGSAAEVYEEFFVPALFGWWPEPLLDAVEAGQGDRILDVGCGTGVFARAALDRVGSAGHVAGLDPNEAMLGVARRLGPGVEWTSGVAERLPYPDASFDRVVSQFALMFFTDRPAAVAEMARVLAPGGTVAVATWASLDSTPGYAAMVELLGELFGDEAADALRAPFLLSDEEELLDLASAAFADPAVALHDGAARFASVDAWIHTEIRGWTLADVIDDEQYEQLLREARRRLDRFTDERGRVAFPMPAMILTAHT